MEQLKRLDFKFHFIDGLPLLFLILTYPATKWLPIRYAYENGPIENFQLIVLLSTFILCIKSKIDKKFFYSLALVCIILFLREINCGRTIFFPIEGLENAFYSLKELPYGFLVHPIYGLFMGLSGLYFILSKSYAVLFKYLLYAKLAVWNWIFLILGIIFGILGEKLGNPILEEMTETLFYLAFMALIFLQSQNDTYIEKIK